MSKVLVLFLSTSERPWRITDNIAVKCGVDLGQDVPTKTRTICLHKPLQE